MNRTQKIFTGLLIVQLLLAAFVYWPRNSASAEAALLLVEFDPVQVSSLGIDDDQGNSLEITREGDFWVLASGGDYPADGEKVDEILSSLQKVTTGRMITQTKASHGRLKVGDDSFLRRLTITYLDGKIDQLFIGSAAGGATSHIRMEGANEVYLADNLAYYSLASQPTAWIDPLYLSLPDQVIIKIALKNNNGTFNFEKNEQGEWQSTDLPAGENLAAANVTSLENILKSLRMVAPLGEEEKPEYGMSNPLASVSYVFKDAGGAEKEASLLIGSQLVDEPGNYVVKSSNSTFFVEASSGIVESFVTRNMQDFILPKPTATVESTVVP